MKKKLFFALTISMTITGLALGDSDTSNLSVSSTITETCQIISVDPIDFGNLPFGEFGVEGFGGVHVNCRSGTPYHISLDAGQNYDGGERRMAKNNEFVRYYLNYKDNGEVWGDSDFANTYPNGTSVANTGNGTDQLHIISAMADPDTGQSAGTYTDTVLVTVHF